MITNIELHIRMFCYLTCTESELVRKLQLSKLSKKNEIDAVQVSCLAGAWQVHSDLDCRIVSKKDFKTSFLGQEFLIA